MNRQHYFSLLFLLAAVWSLNSAYNPSNPPTSNTGAPGEKTCQQSGCHSGGAFTGTVTITGVPDTVLAGQVYPITLEHLSNAEIAGFQLTALDGANAKAGTLTAGSGSNTANGIMSRQYVRHSNPKQLVSQKTTWTFNWTAPAAAGGNNITYYFSSLAANNNSDDSGDNVLTGVKSVVFRPTVATGEPQAAQWVKCYPTVTSDRLNVELLNGQQGYLHLFDAQGKLVLEQQLSGQSVFSVAGFQKGLYHARIESNKLVSVQKFVIQ
ncbi:MAG: choice-of-anchor V domain-containing protein [Saprospiraceae bacterium]